ncbi:ATP-grasp domain-containing protein [Streptomyces ficellus]|uniref:ATP-grasp domain-containing protein n=1 Tax=Streptomyces ficellus TaxID=1977088 RepID=A0ABT7Z1B1_9ACTN|nr:ATP-grasp domain-containing protein [Streptomyces ficellus]MDN3293274.1 ATP-grasp domain-containing protein [Streptomyces ficellus]
MNTHGMLALAPQYTTTGELLAAAAERRGMRVEVLPAHGSAAAVPAGRECHYYGGPLFAAGVVDDLAVALLEPADGWLATLPFAYTRRRVAEVTLGDARRLTRPAFVKPPSDKSFPAAVYADGGRLPGDPDLPSDTPVLVSDVVTWEAEFRLFVLDGRVLTGSQYAAFGRLDAVPLDGHRHRDAALDFAADLLGACGDTLPSAVVVDVGLLTAPEAGAPEGWAVVEANMAWFSNCYAADPDRALDVVLRSAGPRGWLAGRDRGFWRG